MASNNRLKANIEKEIFSYAMTDKANIDVTVDDGWVYLNGYVKSLNDRKDILDRINGKFGVSVVISKLAIVPSGNERDVRSARIIINNLAKSNEILIDRINVTVRNGTVELSGKVKSWDAKEKAVMIARNSTTMNTVKEHLVVMK